ncbi:hypothetical protein MCHUDSM44219_05495 [Mycolicibacterium chubuense]|uniref:Lipoprotein LpqJ n=2 Tax=Mycolicibacterium chubuense TaxID=1800 RepID=A0A0J6VHE9_MYCCU|nr:hypothetical protein MCHUDSM44219_05495 [Mycolicibacterium chubuense]SPX99377.1 putative lipoprotein LpqJ [Mycolicibacterium chubuense]
MKNPASHFRNTGHTLRTLGQVTMRLVTAGVLAVALLAGCQSSIEGTATRSPDTGIEPDFPTPRPSRSTPPPVTTAPAPSPTAPTRAPSGEVLSPQNGYVFIQTKSGKTRCQLDEQEVGCESAFTNAPEVEGEPANGVRLTADGRVSWVLGNLGAIPAVTLDYRTYSALGWTIDAAEDGTTFTNDGTGHGMTISVEGVESF